MQQYRTSKDSEGYIYGMCHRFCEKLQGDNLTENVKTESAIGKMLRRWVRCALLIGSAALWTACGQGMGGMRDASYSTLHNGNVDCLVSKTDGSLLKGGNVLLCIGNVNEESNVDSSVNTDSIENILMANKFRIETSSEDTSLFPNWVWHTHWMNAYIKFIRNYKFGPWNNSESTVMDYNIAVFAYIDADTIPELVFTSPYGGGSSTILTYNGENVNIWRSWRLSVEWKDGTGWILNDDGHQGIYYERYIHLKDGIFTNVLTYEINDREAAPGMLKQLYVIFYGDTVCNYKECFYDDYKKCSYYDAMLCKWEKLSAVLEYKTMPLALIGEFDVQEFLSRVVRYESMY